MAGSNAVQHQRVARHARCPRPRSGGAAARASACGRASVRIFWASSLCGHNLQGRVPARRASIRPRQLRGLCLDRLPGSLGRVASSWSTALDTLGPAARSERLNFLDSEPFARQWAAWGPTFICDEVSDEELVSQPRRALLKDCVRRSLAESPAASWQGTAPCTREECTRASAD